MFRPDGPIRFVLLAFVLLATPVAAGVTLPTVTLSVDDGMAAEAGQDPASFTVTRTTEAGTSSQLFVYLQLGGSAARGTDYNVTNLNLVSGNLYSTAIPAGQTSVTVTLTPIRDNRIEGTEDITFTLSAPQSPGHDYLIGMPDSGAATLTDDVAEVTLTVLDPMAAEAGQDPASFTVTRNTQGNIALQLFVYLQLGGSAARGTDYNVTNLNLVGGNLYSTSIPASAPSQTIVITPLIDQLTEGDETVTLTVVAPQDSGHGYTVGNPSQGQVVITDNPPSIFEHGFENDD